MREYDFSNNVLSYLSHFMNYCHIYHHIFSSYKTFIKNIPHLRITFLCHNLHEVIVLTLYFGILLLTQIESLLFGQQTFVMSNIGYSFLPVYSKQLNLTVDCQTFTHISIR